MAFSAIGLLTVPVHAQIDNLQVADTDLPGWWEADGIAWDALGLRPTLSDHGLDLFASYTMDVFGNTTGGLKRGTVYAGLLNFGADLDLEKAVGWHGASVSTTWLWLSGRDASEDLVGNFLTISNIAGFNTLRMFELWFQQNFLDNAISLRVGQLAADSEFIISDYAALFLNGTFGWPAFAYTNIPEGGPGYPMGTLGVRIAAQPAPWLSLLAAGFQGNVFAQDVNRHGFRYRLDARDGYTFLGESQARWNQSDDEQGLPGQLKGGLWFQTGKYADPLADSTSSGNCGFYAILDQMIFREAAAEASPSPADDRGPGNAKSVKQLVPVQTEKSDQGLGFFTRVAFTPQDRNFVDFYFDTGLTYKGLIPTRDNDTLGVAFGYAQISNGARSGLADEGSRPARAEMVLETTYQIQINPWLILQPDLQYIIQPNATRDLGNALLLGFRANVTF